MCRIINNFFTVLINVVEMYGGDIIKFSGDALTVIFPVLPAGGASASGGIVAVRLDELPLLPQALPPHLGLRGKGYGSGGYSAAPAYKVCVQGFCGRLTEAIIPSSSSPSICSKYSSTTHLTY